MFLLGCLREHETGDRVKRSRILPRSGRLLVHTDLHGNGEDFRRLKQRFFEMRRENAETHWVILGDIVHGPCNEAGEVHPEVYRYPDESWEIVSEISQLLREYPEHIHFVLGNHDFSHIGGPRTGRFYRDEAKALESRLTPQQVMVLHDLMHSALFAIIAPCGILMTHGCPSDALTDLAQLEDIELPPNPDDIAGRRILGGLLFPYSQRPEVTDRLLINLSRDDLELSMVVYGHDRDPDGWFSEWDNQLCIILFGAEPAARRYLELDLAARYRSVRELRHGIEIKRLYPELDPLP